MKKKKSDKVKEIIRRILFFPFWLITSPFMWLLTSSSFKDLWIEFFEMTEIKEETW